MLLAAMAAASCSGCAIAQVVLQARVRDCQGFNAPLASLAGSSRKELRVRVVARLVDTDFPFVVESDANSFVLIGFTPLGTKAFTLVRHGDDVKVENLIGPGMRVPPGNVMSDVLAMSIPSTCSATPDEVASTTAGTWQIRDTCKDGRPVERNLKPATAGPDDKPEMTVMYGGDAITVRQTACRYISRYVLQAAAPVTTAATPLRPTRIPTKTTAARPAAAPQSMIPAASTAAPAAATTPAAAPPAAEPAKSKSKWSSWFGRKEPKPPAVQASPAAPAAATVSSPPAAAPATAAPPPPSPVSGAPAASLAPAQPAAPTAAPAAVTTVTTKKKLAKPQWSLFKREDKPAAPPSEPPPAAATPAATSAGAGSAPPR